MAIPRFKELLRTPRNEKISIWPYLLVSVILLTNPLLLIAYIVWKEWWGNKNDKKNTDTHVQ